MEPPVRDPAAPAPASTEELHLLLSEMTDELAAYRWREAIWISVVVHVLFFLALALSPKWMSWFPQSGVVVPVQPPPKQETTYLEMPRDQQHIKAPKTDIISDKNRVAESRMPLPNRETLRKLLDARRPGPRAPAPQPAPQPPTQAAAPPQPAPQQGGQASPQQKSEQATLQAPRPAHTGPSPFTIQSPGASLDQAIQSAAAASRPRTTFGGDNGSLAPHSRAETKGDMEILSDTMGVDFAPYMQRLHYAVQRSWDPLIPEIAQPPVMKKGVVIIEFAIMKDGSVRGMKLVASSGDQALDRAAWGAILYAQPLPKLPQQFTGDYFLLRAHFYYNPDRNAFQ